VRELEHLERLVLLTTRPVITPDEIRHWLIFSICRRPSASHPRFHRKSASLPQSVEELSGRG
jgi:hypothetical protein